MFENIQSVKAQARGRRKEPAHRGHRARETKLHTRRPYSSDKHKQQDARGRGTQKSYF